MKPQKLKSRTFLFVFICFLPVLATGQWYKYWPNIKQIQLNDIHFVDEENGWVSGNNGILYHTINAGENWELIEVNISGITPDISSISFINPYHGMACSFDGMILKTDYGGNTWQIVKESNERFISIYYFGDVAYAASSEQIFKMNGDENIWEQIDLDIIQPYTITGFFFLNETTGWFCVKEMQGTSSWNGYVFRTTDGLENWETVTFDPNGRFNVYFLDEENGWASASWGNGQKGIYKTFNSGNSWNPSNSDIGAYNMFFLSMGKGWITNDDGIYILDQNTWNQQYSSLSCSDICFVNDQKGWCIGYDVLSGMQWSQILYTNNGGVYVNDTDGIKIDVFPNPFKGNIKITIPLAFSGSAKLCITSINMNRHIAKEISIHNSETIYNTSDLSKGVYLIKIILPEGNFTRKMIKI